MYMKNEHIKLGEAKTEQEIFQDYDGKAFLQEYAYDLWIVNQYLYSAIIKRLTPKNIFTKDDHIKALNFLYNDVEVSKYAREDDLLKSVKESDVFDDIYWRTPVVYYLDDERR